MSLRAELRSKRNTAIWIGPLLVPFGYVGIIDRWLGIMVFAFAIGVTVIGVRTSFVGRRPLWRRSCAVAVLCVVFLPGARFAFNNFGVDVSGHTVVVDGRSRTVLIHVPPKLDASGETPVVLAFHGLMQSGRSFARLTRLNRLADEEGFVVVYPEGYLRSWNDGDDSKLATRKGIDDLAFIRVLLEALPEIAPVDTSRIYAVGFSNGGFLLARHSCALADDLAAAGFVGSGVYPLWSPDCRSTRSLPAMFINGSDDPMLRPVNERFDRSPAHSGRLWAEAHDCDGHVIPEALPDGGDDDVTSVSRITYSSCRDSLRIAQLDIAGGGHVWPGGRKYLPSFMVGSYTTDLDATRELWSYLSGYSAD